ncbi:MAG: insulinase family protein [Bacteroidales bacterium]|nr:insulinase family protein [Bacteroidales bacterium]
MELLHHTLDNGIRLVHHRTNGITAHCGLIINTGSRDEKEKEHGMAHFVEHMLFKGTRKRKPYYIFSRLDNEGGELNAYTSKEETVIHASVLREDFEKAIDIISDMAYNSVFPEKEIAKEKEVIIEEINSCLDNPAELIYDNFEEMVFEGESLGRNILGTPRHIRSITRDTLTDFVRKNYNTTETIFCSAGNIPDKKIIRLFNKYFGNIPEKNHRSSRKQKHQYIPSTRIETRDTNQNHCIIGNIAFGYRDRRRFGLILLSNILGGQGLNSRLNMSLREKRGLVYNVESGYNSYRDSGIITIYFGTDSQNLEKSISIVNTELDKLRKTSLGTLQMHASKKQLKGYLARGYENHESLMLSLGKRLLVFNKIDSYEEICSRIDSITPSELLDTANEVFNPDKLSTLIFK